MMKNKFLKVLINIEIIKDKNFYPNNNLLNSNKLSNSNFNNFVNILIR